MKTLSGCLAAILLLSVAVCAQPVDDDQDGLPDALESTLLEQFRPTFMVNREDCDHLPATLAPGEAVPRVLARDGTIYGQATPHASGVVELRYFHLWAHDCGRNGHAGDVEHVSALLRRQPDGSWTAQYWFAAAHEGTVCDRCMAGRAQPLHAVDRGPVVWISAGKHASYFDQALCNGGCGGDSCPNMQAAPVLAIVNLGEPGTPLNGASWASVTSWPLARPASDFGPTVLAQLDAAGGDAPIRVNATTMGMQRTVSVSNTTLGGLETAQNHTGNALQRSYRAVKGWLHGK